VKVWERILVNLVNFHPYMKGRLVMLNIQVRNNDGGIKQLEEQTSTDVIRILSEHDTEKVSFELEGGVRIALYSDGTYQIFGGLLNYPFLEVGELK